MGPRENEKIQSVAHHTEDDDDGQVIEIEEIQTFQSEIETGRHVGRWIIEIDFRCVHIFTGEIWRIQHDERRLVVRQLHSDLK